MKATLFFIIISWTCASAAERWALPDQLVTPGAINPAATPASLCAGTLEAKKPPVPPWVAEFELSSYNIATSNSAGYVLDYLIPLSLGGANTVSNLWPQPRKDAERKAQLEAALLRRVCAAYKDLTPQDAAQVLINVQHDVAEDWTEAYASYVDR